MPKKLDYDIEIGSVARAEGSPFKRSNDLPTDHTLALAYESSWDADGAALVIATPDTGLAVKLLRKYAAQTDRGVRVQENDNHSVTFSARPKRVVVREIEER